MSYDEVDWKSAFPKRHYLKEWFYEWLCLIDTLAFIVTFMRWSPNFETKIMERSFKTMDDTSVTLLKTKEANMIRKNLYPLILATIVLGFLGLQMYGCAGIVINPDDVPTYCRIAQDTGVAISTAAILYPPAMTALQAMKPGLITLKTRIETALVNGQDPNVTLADANGVVFAGLMDVIQGLVPVITPEVYGLIIAGYVLIWDVVTLNIQTQALTIDQDRILLALVNGLLLPLPPMGKAPKIKAGQKMTEAPELQKALDAVRGKPILLNQKVWFMKLPQKR